MDGGNTSNNNQTGPDSLLYLNSRSFRLLPPSHALGGCYHALKFGARDGIDGFLHSLAHDLAVRERLRLEALRWAAYFGGWGLDGEGRAWLVENIFTGRLGLYEVVCSGPPPGKKKTPEEKKALPGAISTMADNTPGVGPIKNALQMVTGTDLGTGEPVSRMGAAAGIALGLVPGGKLLSKVAGKKVSEKLGEKGLAQAQQRTGDVTDPRFVKRHKGPDGMTRDSSGKLTEREAKGAQDGNTRVATSKDGFKQGSNEKNRAYAEKMLRQKKKVDKPSNRIGGPYTAQEMELWQEVKYNGGRKNHMSAHTNTETGQVRVFDRDHRGDIVKQTDEFQLDDFAATKQKLIEELGE